jgi:hypothetical protein
MAWEGIYCRPQFLWRWQQQKCSIIVQHPIRRHYIWMPVRVWAVTQSLQPKVICRSEHYGIRRHVIAQHGCGGSHITCLCRPMPQCFIHNATHRMPWSGKSQLWWHRWKPEPIGGSGGAALIQAARNVLVAYHTSIGRHCIWMPNTMVCVYTCLMHVMGGMALERGCGHYIWTIAC